MHLFCLPPWLCLSCLVGATLLPLCRGLLGHAALVLDVHSRFGAKQKLAFTHDLFTDGQAFSDDR